MNNDSNDSETVRDTLIDLQPYCDAELDEAMRELMAIEAGERDLAVLQEVARRSHVRRGFSSRIAAWLTAGLVMLCTAPAFADDSPRAKRPTICVSGDIVTGKGGFTGFLCTDGKRPKLFTRFMVVKFIDSEGEPASYVLGWTTVQPKAKPAPVATLKL